jgi:pSer/pThr/pTyr-binding forkhead associated (FHA) protein
MPDESTRPPTELIVKNEEHDLEFKLLLGNALFQESSCLVVQFPEFDVSLTLNPGRETLFGRFENNGSDPAQVDLTSYEGRKKGVSRLHAAIYRTKHTLSLADLDSSNGTYLNGERLQPQQSRVLRDGDEIRFGELAAKIHFR